MSQSEQHRESHEGSSRRERRHDERDSRDERRPRDDRPRDDRPRDDRPREDRRHEDRGSRDERRSHRHHTDDDRERRHRRDEADTEGGHRHRSRREEDRSRRHHDGSKRSRSPRRHDDRRSSAHDDDGTHRARDVDRRREGDSRRHRDDDRGAQDYAPREEGRIASGSSTKIASKFGERIDASSIRVNPYLAYGTEPGNYPPSTPPGGIDAAAIARMMGLSAPSTSGSGGGNGDEEADHDFNNIHQDSFFSTDTPPTQILTPISIKVGGVRLGLPKDTEKYFIVKKAEDLTEEERGALVMYQGAGALATMGDAAFNLSAIMPMVSGELARVARENRRLHVSGFPRGTTKQDLEALFSDWGHTLRRKLTATRMKRQGKATEADNLPHDAIFTVDKVLEVFLDETKDKPFSFIEFNNDDICDVFIEHGDDETVVLTLRDGRSYPIKINRPRDYSPIFKTDEFRITIQGIPPLLTERNVRQLVESADAKITDFQMKDHVAYVEFEDDEKAEDALKFLNGLVIRNHVIVSCFLTDVMRAHMVQQGFRIPARVDPINDEALARAEEGDVLQEILQLQGLLPQTLSRLYRYNFPFLKPIVGVQAPVFPTRILVLLNIVDELDLEYNDVYGDLKARILEEASKYGQVKQLIVPRYEPKPTPPALFVPTVNPKPSPLGRFPKEDEAALEAYNEAIAAQQEEIAAYEQSKRDFHKNTEVWKSNQQHAVYGYGIGKVFIEFEDVKGAEMAQRNMAGRLFCNRTVVTSFLFEDILYPELLNEKVLAAHHEEEEEDGAADKSGNDSNANGEE